MMETKHFKRLNKFILLGILFCFSNCSTLHQKSPRWIAARSTAPLFELSANQVVNGGLLVLTAQLPQNTTEDALTVQFGEIKIPLFEAKNHGNGFYQALIGIPLSTKPGHFEIKIHLNSGAETKNIIIPFEVTDGNYRSEILKVNPKHVKLQKKDLKRVLSENAEMGLLYKKLRNEKLWMGPFALPIASEMTSPYGTSRVYNGELQSYHSGVDLKAAEGTPVKAAANGIVVLAKDLFLSGNTVILEHGYGVFTNYAHLSELKVKVGDAVKMQDLLGLSGMSGRASGPHLHWGVIIHRAKINPIEMTKLED